MTNCNQIKSPWFNKTTLNGQHFISLPTYNYSLSMAGLLPFHSSPLSHLRHTSSQFYTLIRLPKLNLNMAILRINEFIERIEIQVTNCPRCHGIMTEGSMTKLDAFKYILGLKNIPKRYNCPDCLKQIKK